MAGLWDTIREGTRAAIYGPPPSPMLAPQPRVEARALGIGSGIPNHAIAAPFTSADYLRAGGLIHGPGATEALRRAWELGVDFNPVASICLFRLMTDFPQAPLRVYKSLGGNKRDVVDDHPLATLLLRPNPYMTRTMLWQHTTYALNAHGNAYWRKIRAGNADTGNVIQLWPLSPDRCGPVREKGSANFIDYYCNKTGPSKADEEEIAPWNIVHFRFGVDDRNHMLGISRLRRVLREVCTDDESAEFVNRLLRNNAVMGLVVLTTPDSAMDADGAAAVKQRIADTFTGDGQGGTAVLSGAVRDVRQLGLDPKSMDIGPMVGRAEALICGVIGVPAQVAGIPIGLEHSTYCMPAATRVWTTTGAVRIADVSAGAVVWSFVNGRLEPRRVTRQWATGVRQTYEIRTKNRRFRATDNHPVLVRIGGGREGNNAARRVTYGWKRVDELRVGDEVVQPKCLPDQGGRHFPDGRAATPEMLQFLGAIVGDGSVTPGMGVSVAMPPDDRCGTFYRELAPRLFTKQVAGGIRPARRRDDGKTETILALVEAGETYKDAGLVVGLSSASARDRYLTATQPKPSVRAPVAICEQPRSFSFGSKQDSLWLAALGLAARATTKRVPSWVYALARDLRLAFLAGLVDSDGSIDKRGCLAFGFANEALTHDVRDLCIGLGIQCSNVSLTTLGPDVLPNPGIQAEYHCWRFVASSAVQVAAIPFADPRYRERVEANPDRVQHGGGDAHKTDLHEDLGFYRVCAITPDTVETVYDIEVEGGHSFVADGVIVHNSNFEQAYESYTELTLLPQYPATCETLDTQLLPDFSGDPKESTGFDTDQLRALQEDMDATSVRVVAQWEANLITRDQALTAIGKDPVGGTEGALYFGEFTARFGGAALAPPPPAATEGRGLGLVKTG